MRMYLGQICTLNMLKVERLFFSLLPGYKLQLLTLSVLWVCWSGCTERSQSSSVKWEKVHQAKKETVNCSAYQYLEACLDEDLISSSHCRYPRRRENGQKSCWRSVKVVFWPSNQPVSSANVAEEGTNEVTRLQLSPLSSFVCTLEEPIMW